MSTRAIVAVSTDEGWEGVYVHSDGYPTSLGKRLVEHCRKWHDGDALSLASFLHSHPAGWSSLGNGDPSHPNIGYQEWSGDLDDKDQWKTYVETPRCFCHGDTDGRGAPDEPLMTQDAQKDCGDIEWFYLVTPEALLVFEGCVEMQPVGSVSWTDEAPDWGRIECGQEYERCTHYAWVHFEDAKGLNLGTAKWLGREPFDKDDAVAYTLADGTEVQKGGSGHAEGYMKSFYLERGDHASAAKYKGERVNGGRWFQSVTLPDGTTKDIAVYYQRGARKGQWCDGVTPIYPALPVCPH